MTEHKDMTISEIEEVLKEYTCEFEHGKKNYYLDYLPDFCFIIKETKYDYTQKKYFESEEKINSFIEKVGDKNAKTYYRYLNKDLIQGDEIYKEGFLSECRFIEDKIKQYIIKSNEERYGVYIIRPYKENGKYVIKYIKLDRFKNSLLGDGCFETLEDAEKAVNEIGEYNILHYLFYIKDSVLKEKVKDESDTTQYKDMALDEIYEIVKEYKRDFREGEINWYVSFKDGMYKCEVTRDSEIHLIYFESEHKIYDFMRRVGYENFNKLFGYLNNDKDIIDDIFNERKNDMVKNPSHYQGKNGLEVYEVLENFLEDVESYYLGNVIKYILRYKNKNGLEDLKKAREYLNKMIERGSDGE